MAEAYIIDACRTPRGIGKVGKGSLAHLHPQHLGATVLSAIRDRNNLDTATVDDIIWGTSSQRGAQGADLGRMAALDAGYDIKASGVTLDRFCGSGITSVNLAAAQVMSGMEDCVIAGGTEMMSYTSSTADPKVPPMLDGGNMSLRAKHPQTQQGVCADAIATLEGIDREAVDQLAFTSQQRAAVAIEEGRFDKSLVAVHNIDGSIALDKEEFPRPGTTMETLGGLKTVFNMYMDIPVDEAGNTYGNLITGKYEALQNGINHVHHAGNSSGIVDGAAAVLFGSKEMGEKHDLKPRARIRAMASIGSEPGIMLTGPTYVTQKALKKAGMNVGDIDIYELNEAFASVPMLMMQLLDIDHDKMNVNGGAIAMGHPLGATGAMLLGTMVDELERTGKETALVTLCVGAGMGTATIIERI